MKTTMLIAISLLALAGCSSESDESDDEASQADLNEACENISFQLGYTLGECFGAEGVAIAAGLNVTCAATTNQDVDDMNDCADEMAVVSCEAFELAEEMPTCDELDDAGKISL